MTASDNRINYALYTYLKTLSAVTALVGSGNNAKIRPDFPDQTDTPPCIWIEVYSEEPQNSIDGKGGLVFAEVSIVCRAYTRKQSRQLAEAVRTNNTDPGTGLAAYGGSGGTMTFDAWLTSTDEADVPVAEGSDKRYYDTYCNYTCCFSETT